MILANRLGLVLVAIAIGSIRLLAQGVVEERGTDVHSEGLHYMVAFPEVWADDSEKPTARPMTLFLSSRSNATIHITTPASINGNARMDRTYTLVANDVLEVPVDVAYMSKESQTRTGYGIEIVGDRPFSVYSYQAWQGNGEMTRHLPVEAWGRSYYSMNFYQDRYGSSGYGFSYRPAQILVIAAYDDTFVSIVPTFHTEGGADLPGITKQTSGNIQLNKGETFLIKGAIDVLETKAFISDLSGTVIAANRPIAVVSGHTKVAIMRFPDALPPTGLAMLEGCIVRNNVHDAMLPVDFADTSFVTVPAMYTVNRVISSESSGQLGVEDVRGDVIRFVATQDNTTIQSMRLDGSGLKTIVRLNRGATWLETTVESATWWTSTKPVLVCQYGKSYARMSPVGGLHKDPGQGLQGSVRVEAGMPMQMTVPPVNRWVSHAVFHAPEGMDNFVSIVFRDGEDAMIRLDGARLSTSLGGSKRTIPGTPFAYIRASVSAGDHVLASESSAVTWMAWTYGSLDGLVSGRAYGTPVAVGLTTPCTDTLDVTETLDCGSGNAVVSLLSGVETCSHLFAVYAESLNNYRLEVQSELPAIGRTAVYTVRVEDPQQNATATVMAQSTSGAFLRKTYTYIADRLQWAPAALQLPTTTVGTQQCSTIVLTNERTDKPLAISALTTKHFPELFAFTPSAVTIPPGGSIEVQMCVTASAIGAFTDTVIAVLDCSSLLTAEIVIRAEEPVIYAGDVSWASVPWESAGIIKVGEIINASDVELVVQDYDSTLLKGNFLPVEGFEVPIVIPARGRHTYQVRYQPGRVPGAPHRVEFPWTSTATRVDSISVWNGSFITNVGDHDATLPVEFYPSPLRRSDGHGLQITGLLEQSQASVFDDLGRLVSTTTLGPGNNTLPASHFPGTGVYTIVLQWKGAYPVRRRIVVWD